MQQTLKDFVIKPLIIKPLNRLGFYYIRGLEPIRTIEDYLSNGAEIRRNGRLQTLEEVAQLRKKYEEPILGEISVHRLMELLAQIIDPTNRFLYCTSQLTHTLQVLESMEEAGITDREFLAAALVHDLGKLAVLKGEEWKNVESGGKIALGQNVPGSGFANCTFNWDHSDIIRARLKPYISKNMLWLIQWHTILPPCHPLMDAHDRVLFDKYYEPFLHHERTASFYHVPKKRLDDYIPLLKEFFPEKILF